MRRDDGTGRAGGRSARAVMMAMAVGAVAVAGGVPRAGAQAIDAMPATAASAAAPADTWVVESVEAPPEIAYDTMSVRIWARVRRESGTAPLTSLAFVLHEGDGELRLPMEPLDGAFDTDREDAAVTVDTYAWVRDETHAWEIRACAGDGAPGKIADGSVRVKPRVPTPDLVVVDERGRLSTWIGSGAGGFLPGGTVECGLPLAPPAVRDIDGDRRPEIVVPGADGALRILEGGADTPVPAREVGCGIGLVAAALGDLDGDGGLDLVSAASPRVLEIRRDLDDVPTQTADLPGEAESMGLADLDGDGRQEIYLAVLGLSSETVERWVPSAAEPGTWESDGVLSPPPGGRGRIIGLVPLPLGSGPGAGHLLVVSRANGEAVLESWGGAADTESVSQSSAPRVLHLPGEPLGAIPGRFSDPASPSWLVWVRQPDRVEWWEVSPDGMPLPRGWLDAEPAAVTALDLDGDGDDDLATGGEELRLWINVRGADFREAGESPYLLEARVVALAAGRLDE